LWLILFLCFSVAMTAGLGAEGKGAPEEKARTPLKGLSGRFLVPGLLTASSPGWTIPVLAGTQAPDSSFAFPEPEAAIYVPKIRRGSASAVLVYRESGTGFFQSQGWDTRVLRFYVSDTGLIRSISLTRRDIYGETPAQRFAILPSQEGFEVQSLKGEVASTLFRLSVSQSGVAIDGGGQGRGLYRLVDGSLIVEHEDSGRTIGQVWNTSGMKMRGSQGSGSYTGDPESRMSFVELPGADPDDPEAVTTLFSLNAHRLRLTAGSVAPICDVFADGLEYLLSGSQALANLAIIEAVLERNGTLRPALAWMLIQGKGRP
jgi:hypothetical protein